MKKILVILVALIGFGINSKASTNKTDSINSFILGESSSKVLPYNAFLKNDKLGYTLSLSKDGTCNFYCGNGCERSGTYTIDNDAITFNWTSSSPFKQVGRVEYYNDNIFAITINEVRYTH